MLKFDVSFQSPGSGGGGVGGSAGIIIETVLLHFVIPFNLICNLTMF